MKNLQMCAEMALAFRADRKTLTSRDHGLGEVNKVPDDWRLYEDIGGTWFLRNNRGEWLDIKPRYRVGDRFYVGEAWAVEHEYDHQPPSRLPAVRKLGVWWLADGPKPAWAGRTRSGRFIPERLARTFGVVVSVTLKRVQDITEAEALAEGVSHEIDGATGRMETSRRAYARILDRLYGPQRWRDNHWGWFYGIKKTEGDAK